MYARDLAHTLVMVKRHRSKTPLPRISHLTAEQQLKAEDDNILADIKWARENLGLYFQRGGPRIAEHARRRRPPRAFRRSPAGAWR